MIIQSSRRLWCEAKVSSIVETSEKIQPDPVLNGEKVIRTRELRYTGLELNDLNKNRYPI